jgi:hypothetical protein
VLVNRIWSLTLELALEVSEQVLDVSEQGIKSIPWCPLVYGE